VTSENLEVFITTTADANQWPTEWRDGAMQGIRNLGLKPESDRFLVRYQGQAAGVGSLGRSADIASLGGAAVIPQFRGKGCHSSLLHHRLHIAHQWGCPVVIATAAFGSTSFYNQQRVGLRLAYVECAWTRPKT
jgi:GNAT superfamily N-acetyltransferase